MVAQSATADNNSSAQGDAQHDQPAVAQVAAAVNATVFNSAHSQPNVAAALQQGMTPAAVRNTTERAENAAPVQQAVSAEPLPAITSAKLMQGIAQTEMRVGVQSPEFGAISIHTSSGGEAITAQISVEHTELAHALATHLPEMQSRFGSEQPIEVRITQQPAAGSSSSFDSSANQQSREQQQPAAKAFGNAYTSDSQTSLQRATMAAVSANPSTTAAGRLDIRA